MELRAQIWYEEGQFEEAKSEVLRATAVYEGIGAMGDVEDCKDLLRDIEDGMRTPVPSGESLETTPPLRLLTFRPQLDVPVAIPQVHPEDVPIGENRHCVGPRSDP